MKAYSWYQQLRKPAWAPPARLFGPVWTVLYVVIVVTFGQVFLLVARGNLAPVAALPFVSNLAFNLAFTPIQFGLKNNALASIDILLILATLIWAMISIFPQAPWVAYAQIPYLLWVSFAAVLQLTVTYLNRQDRRRGPAPK